MAKVKHSVATRRRKKRVLKQAEGYWGDRSKQFQQARRAVMHALFINAQESQTRFPEGSGSEANRLPLCGHEINESKRLKTQVD